MWFCKGTTDQVWATIQIVYRAAEYNTAAHLCFIDLKKAYDWVNHDAFIAIVRNYKVPSHLVDIISEMYTNTWCQVRTTVGASEEFKVVSGVRQGFPLVFNCFMDRVLREPLRMTPGGWRIEYTTTMGLFLSYIQRRHCAPQTSRTFSTLLISPWLQNLLVSCKPWCMHMIINATKTRTVTISKD